MNPKSEAQKIFNSHGYEKGREYIMEQLYFSGSSTAWRLVWNEFQKFEI
jgi:hypothetical protein